MFKLTENYGLLNYYGLYRVRLAVVVDRSGFVRKILKLNLDSGALIFRVAKRRENNHVMGYYVHVVTLRGRYNSFIKNAGTF